MADSAPQARVRLSRWQLDLFCKCPRCFWLLKRHNIKQPDSYPLALNNCMDHLLKAEFDEYRAAGQIHPVFASHQIAAKLFADLQRLTEWRNTFQGLRWTDPATGHTLFGAVDDILEFPDGTLAVVDYKSSGAAEAHVYDSYQLQMDVYTHLLQRMGYRTAPRAFFAFFLAVRTDGFRGRLPFRAEVLEVTPQPDRVPELFAHAAALAQQAAMPASGAECDLCRWSRDTAPLLAPSPAAPSPAKADPPPARAIPAAREPARPARKRAEASSGPQQTRFGFAM